MLAFELREKYLTFFEKHKHVRIQGSSLVPENDPTVLFTTAGMHPLVPYIMGENHPAGSRLVNCQRCIRTGDIDSVGDHSHLTFFEMLGNWSLGDYFKAEAIDMSFEFLTDSNYLGIPIDRLSVSVYEGDASIPPDEESAKLWHELGIVKSRIHFLDKSNNWWGPPGQTGPCGPDTEMFFDTMPPDFTKASAHEDAGKDVLEDGRHLEIWNDVFMEYKKTADGSYEVLKRKCVDTGMGLERTAAILQGKRSVFETELFIPIFKALESVQKHEYNVIETPECAQANKALRIIADHVRTAVFLLGDEKAITPSNMGQGYILRRLIRRAMRFGRQLGVEAQFLCAPAEAVIDVYASVYSLLGKTKDFILQELALEEARFLSTLRRGEKEFEKISQRLKAEGTEEISGKDVFHLYDTYGFPREVTTELAKEHHLTVDDEGFEKEFSAHQEISRQDSSQTFKGGLADHSEETTKLHTATHLLHESLRRVLGTHVSQKGSNITKDRLRFDFSHPEKMTREQIERVEKLVNEQIQRAVPVSLETMSLDAAREKGALAFFGEKYDEVVKVYSIGSFSKEVCGGSHVHNTKELGTFKILKEQSSSQGVRRIKAVLS